MKKLILMIFFIFLCTFNGQAEVLAPLTVGNYWKYVNDKGELSVSKIVKSEMFQGHSWYLLEDFGDMFWIRNGEDGQYELKDQVNIETIPLDEPINEVLQFKYPIDGFENYFTDYDRIMAKTLYDSIEVPAGTFDNIVVYTIVMSDKDYAKNWYAPGVGLIKLEMNFGGEIEIYELIEYEIQ